MLYNWYVLQSCEALETDLLESRREILAILIKVL